MCALHVHLPERLCPGESVWEIPEDSHMRLSVEAFVLNHYL